jgi:hypothetical protein
MAWDDVGVPLKFGIDGLQNEIDVLTNFLTKSHELVSSKLSPRVRVETVLVNEAKSRTTVRPYGALQLGVAGADSSFHVATKLVASIGAK